MDESVDAKHINGQIEDWKSQFDDWRDEAREAYDFVAGKQWSDEDQAAMEGAQRPTVSLNLVASAVRGVCGLEVGNRQEVRYLPRELGDVQANEVLDAAAQWVRDQCNAEDEESEAFRDCVVCGIGACELRVDYAEDPAGSILIERLDPLHVAWDPGAKKRGLTDARWVGTWKWLPLAEIRRLWPEAEAIGIEQDETEDDEDEAGSWHDREAARNYEAGPSSQTGRKGIKVTQYQYFVDVPIWRVQGLQGQSMDLPQEKFAAIQPRLQELGLQARQLSKRQYRQAFVAKGQLLEDQVLPVECFTLCFITGYRDRNRGSWYGFVRDIMEPQKYVNKMYSLGIDILANDAKGGLLAEADAFESTDQAEKDWSNPRKIIWMRPGGINKVQPRQSTGTPAAVERILQGTIELLPRISGISMEFLGTTDRTQAGILEHQRKQSTITTLGELFAALTLFRKQSGKVLAELIVRYLNDGRLIRVAGKQREAFVPLLLQPGALDFDVVVDEMPAASDVKMRTFAVLQEMLPMAVQAGVPIPPSIVDYMPIPSALAGEWKEQLSQPAVPPEVQMQIQQGMAVIQQQQAEIQKLKSDQSAKMAELQQKWQQSMMELQAEKENTAAELDLKRQVAETEAQIEAEKAAATIILQREKALADFQLKAAEVRAANLDPQVIEGNIGELKDTAAQLREEIGQLRQLANTSIAQLGADLEKAVKPRRKTRRSVSVRRDKSGRIVSALIDEDSDD